jgi:Subtilisin inhibitor-like
MRRFTSIPAVALLTAIAAACGSINSAGSAGAVRTPSARLEIVISPGLVAFAEVRRYRLTCRPAGGTLPHPASACAALAGNPDLLDPLPPECHKIVSDAGSRSVTGQFEGQRIGLGFMCPNGGRRWGRLAVALGLVSPASG